MKLAPVRMRSRPQRTALEQVLMRAPLLMRLAVGVFAQMPPRLRRRVVAQATDRAFAATNRGDVEFAKLFYRPDVVLRFSEQMGPDFLMRYEGRDAMFEAYLRWIESWGGQVRVPLGFIDRGDHLIMLLRERMRGETSGLEVEREVGQVVRLRGGLVAEQIEYRSWDEALRH